ncbi:HIT family protein [Nonomuraea gerenzanensis]|uniref:Histidine triad (HIT) nucleotide-binding protein, similarity with At5g48545 and yeast YDL125C (HNT1) n=1 Tax=Nonomuraea gerenzanensis TaxID=93944 RepID=A0A1M4EJE8_9ACTN|nr:HIT family protein [Nonomuraea gerenzanensis]UBU10432.1 HIT family protein [Nonomuraea gerenzanensis]SBO98828.1 Histidine triad (HIT) nucleotide-binding protein, similarity with At5g48545 and yeast YDL125C (HNT1) [Nonomuraea gerenzanensis]
MSTDLFCEIIAGERPAYVVSSDEVAVSFLDTRPVFKGHVLVVPRAHVETLTDLGDVGPFFERVQAMARAVEQGLQAGGTFVAMNNRISQSVAHLHVHVVPRNKKDGLRGFFWPRTAYDSAEEAQSYADLVSKAL